MSIVLHIERLVLDETLLGGERAGSVRATIERELARRLSQPGALDVLRGIGAVDRLPASPTAVAAHPHDSLGVRIATAVGNGLGVPSVAALSTHGHLTQGHGHG